MIRRKLSVLLMVGAVLGAVACGDDDPIEPSPETFAATMTGFQESPVVNTAATGSAEVVFTTDGLTFTVNVQSIANVTAAHIHTSQTGGVVLNLNPTLTVTNGVLAAGTANASTTLSGGFPAGAAGIDSLKSLIRRGNAYVNVHNQANTGGHIRGQLVRVN